MSFLSRIFGTRSHPKCVQFSAFKMPEPPVVEEVVSQKKPKRKRAPRSKLKVLGKVGGVTLYARKAR